MLLFSFMRTNANVIKILIFPFFKNKKKSMDGQCCVCNSRLQRLFSLIKINQLNRNFNRFSSHNFYLFNFKLVDACSILTTFSSFLFSFFITLMSVSFVYSVRKCNIRNFNHLIWYVFFSLSVFYVPIFTLDHTIVHFVCGGSYRFVHNFCFFSHSQFVCVLKKQKKTKYKN